MNETWLTHHGILGQKWGVRRYQNKDGSLTAAGRKHYDIAGEYAKKHAEIQSEKANVAKKTMDRLSKDNPNRLKNIFDDYEYEGKFNLKDERLKTQLEDDANFEYNQASDLYKFHTENAKKWMAASNKYMSMTKISDIDKKYIKKAKAFANLHKKGDYGIFANLLVKDL